MTVSPAPQPEGAATCDCGMEIKRKMAAMDVETTVSPRRPGMVMPRGFVGSELNMRCPHGVSWWAEPTIEQRLRWAKDRVS